MEATDAFVAFVKRTLIPEKARRFASLAETKNGQRKILRGLCHEFEPAIISKAVHSGGYDAIWNQPCYIFQERAGFGIEAASVREAYDQLSIKDSWLILLRDSSVGIYRPEARWDDEKFIKA